MFESLLQFPALVEELFQIPAIEKLSAQSSDHAPRFLMLYGSLRERSYSRLLTFEAARLLMAMGGEVKIFDPTGLPLVDSLPDTHPKVQELRQMALWAEGMVWTSPERHGAMTGLLKTQIDWIPLADGAVSETSACPSAAVTGRRRCQKCIDAKKLHKNRVDYQQYKNRPKDAEARKIYTSALWRKSRAHFFAHSPWCVECGKEGVMTVATALDHKVSIADGCDPWDAENWQGLCKRHHSEKTASETLHRKGAK